MLLIKLNFIPSLVEPVVSLTKGPNPLIDGANQTTAAICTAATGKPAAEIDWEGGLGEMESSSTLFPNETVTVVSQYNIVPTRFARGRRITCIVKHPALEKEIRYSHVLDIQCKYTSGYLFIMIAFFINFYLPQGDEHLQLQEKRKLKKTM